MSVVNRCTVARRITVHRPGWLNVVYAKRRLSSVDSTADAADAAASKLGQSIATLHRPRPIFPWRHDDNYLPRLTPGSPEFNSDILLPTKGEAFMASVFLNYSFLDTYWGNSWRKELAEASTWAFSQGVAGIVSNVYKMPFKSVLTDSGQMDFSFSPNEAATDGEKEASYCPEVEYMLSRPLRDLYQSAHESGRDQFRIRLQMLPIRSTLYSLFCIPFLTREAIGKDPALLDEMISYHVMMRTSPIQGIQGFYGWMLKQLQKNEGNLFTTVDLQVLVECEEIFQVQDISSGNILQGFEDGKSRKVLHLVRLETNVRSFAGQSFPHFLKQEPGNFQITDIDDLLGTKKWYHRVNG
jgi:hypothetical protein